MNFRVDLILAEEQRSASLLNPKSITRIVSIVVPVAIGLLIAKFAFGVITEGNRAADREQKWKLTEPRSAKAAQVKMALNSNLDMVDEFAGWRETHLNWHEHLAALQQMVPANIQLTSLSIQQSLLSDPVPSRAFQILIAGRSSGDPNGVRLSQFVADFERVQPLQEAVKKDTAKVANGTFTQDPSPQAQKDDRVFRIECSYKERVFK